MDDKVVDLKKTEGTNKFGELKDLLHQLHRTLRRIDDIMPEVSALVKVDYSNVPGITGTFDGVYLITESGEKIEVPSNYAAKSRLVCGDVLKKIEEGGKTLFKQIEKVSRKKLDAVINKKDGKWYALAETGSYRIVDSVAEFNQLEVNDKVEIVIPELNTNAPYAALEKGPERLKPVVTPVAVPAERKPIVPEVMPEESVGVAPKRPLVRAEDALIVTPEPEIRRPVSSSARPRSSSVAPRPRSGGYSQDNRRSSAPSSGRSGGPSRDYSSRTPRGGDREYVDQIGNTPTNPTPNPTTPSNRAAELLDDDLR